MIATGLVYKPKHVHHSKSASQERRCALTHTVRSKSELLRFVADPEDCIVPDLKTQLPGRGVWITAQKHKVDQAEQRNIFAKNLRRKVRIEPGLAARVEHLLRSHLLGALSLARKSGHLLTDLRKVLQALRSNQTQALIVAQDASNNSMDKLNMSLAHIKNKTSKPIPVFQFLTSTQLSLVFGDKPVIYAAASGRLKIKRASSKQRAEMGRPAANLFGRMKKEYEKFDRSSITGLYRQQYNSR